MHINNINYKIIQRRYNYIYIYIFTNLQSGTGWDDLIAWVRCEDACIKSFMPWKTLSDMKDLCFRSLIAFTVSKYSLPMVPLTFYRRKLCFHWELDSFTSSAAFVSRLLGNEKGPIIYIKSVKIRITTNHSQISLSLLCMHSSAYCLKLHKYVYCMHDQLHI